MDRRRFLSGALVASGVAFLPTIALAKSKELIVDRWDNSEPWPGLKVRCLDLVTGLQHGFCFYIEHPSDEVVRYMLPLCVLDAREHGRLIPETDVSECRPEYRERIAEAMRENIEFADAHRSDALANWIELPRYGLLVREKVSVEVAGPADIMARFENEIPKSWERRPSVPTDVAAVLAADVGPGPYIYDRHDYQGESTVNKEADVLSRYFYQHQTQVEIAEAWGNSQPTIAYRINRGLDKLSPLQRGRVITGMA